MYHRYRGFWIFIYERRTLTMKKKIVVSIMLFVMFFIMKTPVYAEDSNRNDEIQKNNAKKLTYVVLAANGSEELDVTLNSYVGFSKEFTVNAVSDNSNGMILVYLYNPKGNLVSHDWIAGVNDATRWKLTLPSSGTWHVKLYAQGTNEKTKCYVGWIQ